MYQREILGLEETQRAVSAMLQEASKDSQRPVSIAVVDDRGDLVYFVRMDGGRLLTAEIARKKAYTAVRMRGDTGEIAERFKSQGRNLTDFGDPNLIALQGGVLVLRSEGGEVLGGIGVSGLRADEDEALAKVGLAAMKL